MNGSRVFVDSNIWLYAMLKMDEDAKWSQAAELVASHDCVINFQVIHEVCSNLIKKRRSNRAEIEKVILGFENVCQIVLPSLKTLHDAEDLRERYSISYWDSLIVAAAKQAGVATLFSDDMQHGLLVDGVLKIVNPFHA
jgi:predicted nucleic acid-binding protein